MGGGDARDPSHWPARESSGVCKCQVAVWLLSTCFCRCRPKVADLRMECLLRRALPQVVPGFWGWDSFGTPHSLRQFPLFISCSCFLAQQVLHHWRSWELSFASPSATNCTT